MNKPLILDEASKRFQRVHDGNIDKQINEATQAFIQAGERRASRANKAVGRIGTPIEVGETVLVKNHFLSNKAMGFNSKLAHTYGGPYIVLRNNYNNSYLLGRKDKPSEIRKAHVRQIKKITEEAVQDGQNDQ